MNNATSKKAGLILNQEKEETRIKMQIKKIGRDLSKEKISKAVIQDRVVVQDRDQIKALKKKIKAIKAWAAMTNQEAEKDKIHAQYDQLRATLRTDVKIDSKMITAMREQETVAVKQVQAAYRAQVKVVEAQIKALEQANRNQAKGGRKK